MTKTTVDKLPVIVNTQDLFIKFIGLSTQSRFTSGQESVNVNPRICIFEGIMDAPLYVEVLEKTSLPFLVAVYPDGHRFMANNDP